MIEFLVSMLIALAVPLAILIVLACWAAIFLFIALEVANILEDKENENE